ncbi:MAG: hypothetical protein RBT80_19175 [Candidatus Vecturithrix sp.]|jgi:hypothetical protein|nr:hypothetical protein [Candidatus Vecturithrix sp.]
MKRADKKMTYGEYCLMDLKAMLILGWIVIPVCRVFNLYPIKWFYWVGLVGLQVFYWVAKRMEHR